MEHETDRKPETGGTWGSAAARAAGILVASILLFVIIPNSLLGYLSLHLVPTWRDLCMVAYITVAFVVGCVVMIMLGPRRSA